MIQHSVWFVQSAAPGQESLLDLVLSSGFLIQLILLSLVGMSVMTWAVVFFKRKILKGLDDATALFLRLYGEAPSLEEVYRWAKGNHAEAPPARVFAAGYEEARKERGGRDAAASRRVERALEVAVAEEGARFERRLGFLASTGSTAPFIGLFGTVWGIMRSFRDIGTLKSADLSVVAPGIAEALIATAVGLFAAIPAVMAYNAYLSRIKGMRRELQGFAQLALNDIERHWPNE